MSDRKAARWASGAAQAHTAVARAIRHGELPSVVGLTCLDCGVAAEHYDHRDYNRPLDVEPVCRKCNFKRGKAVHLSPPPSQQTEFSRERQTRPPD